RLNVVPVRLNSLLQSKRAISRCSQSLRRLKCRRNFDVIAHAVVQCYVRIDAPGILPESSDGDVTERIAGAAETLNEVSGQSCAVCLDGGELWKLGKQAGSRIDESEIRCAERAEIVNTAVVDGKDCGQRQVIEVAAELRVVASDRPRKVVGELIALLGAL